MDPQPPGDLQEQLNELRARILRLEEALDNHGVLAQKETARSLPENANVRPLSPPSSLPAAPVAADQPQRSLESRIGSQWLNRIGILAVLMGMAWFLKLAVDNHWIGPWGRVLVGLAAGIGIFAWSERFRRGGYAGFAYSLKAVGSGILYLSLWAGFSLLHLIPAAVAFAAMILITACNGFLSWAQDAELLALYAIAGGLATPLLISTGENLESALFAYLLVLNAAVLVLVALRPWSRLLFASFLGTVLLFAGWWFEYYSVGQSLRTAFFLGCFFLIFAFAPRMVRVDAETYARSPAWNSLALILLPVVNAGLGFLGFYAILDSSRAAWAEPWLAVFFAAFYLLLLRLPARGILRGSPAVLQPLHLTAAIVFLTIAIPLEIHGRWLTIGWLAEGAALLWSAIHVHLRPLKILALSCLALGFGALVAVNPPASTTPFLNQRFAAFCAGIAVFSVVAWLASKAPPEPGPESLLRWPSVARVAALAVNALILLAIGWEIHSYWWHLRWQGDWQGMHDCRIDAQFTYSAFFMLFGAILLGAGFWRRSAGLRWQGLLLLAISIGKVFLVDVSELSQGYRIVSFLGLGGLLLAVSFVYQRDWLNLRRRERSTGTLP